MDAAMVQLVCHWDHGKRLVPVFEATGAHLGKNMEK